MVLARARRIVAGAVLASLASTCVAVVLAPPASAATTSLFNQPFHNRTADGDGAVVLPASANAATNVACLSASGNTTVTPKSCATAPDAQGAGKLRLTDNTTFKGGSLFAATSVPTVSGLDVSFTTYQYGSSATPADGIAFALAAVDPTSPLSPANFGAVGGALGYSTGVPQGSTRVNGLAYGYLGFGFDVYGNFSNSVYQGTSCTSPAYVSTTGGRVPNQAVIRGPGNGTAGYCALNSTATTTTSPAVALRGSTRTAAKVPVEIVLNPRTTSITTASGLSVAARGYTMAFTPVGGTQRVLTGALPVVGSQLGFPTSWLDASGYPKQLAFGWVGSTGSQVDYHEVDEVKVVSLGSVPELSVEQTAYTQPTLSPGDPVTYKVTAGVEQGVDETAPVSVTDTLPAGVTPVGGSGTGWVCAPPSGQKITCTNSNGPFKANTDLPELTITGTVTGTNVTPAVIRTNSIVTASSNDANPGYSNTAAAGTPSNAPSNLAITPGTGPAGTSTTITGTNVSAATAVQIGTLAELSAGTGRTLTRCADDVPTAGCFAVDADGHLVIASMPAHANGAVQVKVVTLGAASSVTYTYTSAPGTPAATAEAGVRSATVTWTAPASGGSAISGYTVTPYRDGVAQAPVVVGADVTSYTVTNATVGSLYTFTVSATNSLGTGVASPRTGAVVPYTVPGVPNAAAASARTGAVELSWTAPADDGHSPVTGYVVTPYRDGSAQTPVTFDAARTTQTVSGLTPGAAYTFTVAAINAAGTGPATAPTTPVTVNDRPTIVDVPGDGEVGVEYDQQLRGAGGTGSLTFELASGSLPDGLTLSASGRITGTPAETGSSTVTARVTDATGSSSTRSFTVVVVPAPQLTFGGLPDGEQGKVYSTDLSRTGGTGPFTYSLSAGRLPAGLVLDGSTGRLAGTPTRGGSYAFTVKVVDALGASDTKSATLVVKAPVEVSLSVSATTLEPGQKFTLDVALDDPSATGGVEYAATNPRGWAAERSESPVKDGRTSAPWSLSEFGTWTVVATYNGDATHLPSRSEPVTVEVAARAGRVVITEFRTSGPAGAEDSYAEIYNPGPSVRLAGFTLVSGSGARTVISESAHLDTQRTYLVGGRDFSLGALATPDQTGSLGTGGLQLVAPDTAATVTDAVGPDKGLHLGKALPTIAGRPTDQWAFVRVEKAGRPVDTGQNASDFALVSSDGGKVGGVQSMRGSASPTGLADDWQHNEQAQSYLLDAGVGAAAVPNRPYVAGKPGLLEIRRTITNTGTRTITSAKARVTSLSEANGLPYHGANPPAAPAAIRAVNPKTPTSRAEVEGRGTVTVQNLEVDAPITAAAGGGLNSTFTLPLPSGGLAPGASVDVAFTFEVDVRGTFWFGYDVDARTADRSSARTGTKGPATVSARTVERRLEAKGQAKTEAVAPLVKGAL